MESTTGLVSFVIPNYNKSKRLYKCLHSLQKLKYSNIEIILVDDGSTDDSLLVAKGISKKDQRIRVYSLPHHGKINALNLGVSKANGTWIKVHGSDDELVSSAINDALNVATSDIIIHNCKLLYKNKIGRDLYSRAQLEFIKSTSKETIVPQRISFASGLYFINRKYIRNIFPIPQDFPYEDWYILWALKNLNASISICNKPLTLYWQEKNTLWGGINTLSIEKRKWRLKRDLIEIEAFEKHGEPKERTYCAKKILQLSINSSIIKIITSRVGFINILKIVSQRYKIFMLANIIMKKIKSLLK